MKSHRTTWLNKSRSVLAVAALVGAAFALEAGPALAQTHREAKVHIERADAEAASAAAPLHVSDPRIIANFDFAAGGTPEAIALEPGGSADVSLSRASTVVNVALDGQVTPLAQLPRTGSCPALGIPFVAGIADAAGGSAFVDNCTGNAETGVWQLHDLVPATQIASLPSDSVPHGMALDSLTGNLYVADSQRGVIWRISPDGGSATVWASGPALQKMTLFGANGVVVHDNAVWVSNTDQGTILEIPFRHDGTAGPIDTVASGFPGDVGAFTVVGPDDTILAALTHSNEIVSIRPGERPQVLLTAADGLSNPTDVALAHRTLYVSNGAYFTHFDPNLLIAQVEG